MKKADIWRWIERVVLIGTIVGMLINNRVDKAIWRTEVKKDLETLKNNDENQKGNWERQLEFNDGVNDYFRLNTGSSRSTQEETED